MIDDSIRRSDVIDELMHIIPYKRYHNGEYILLLNKKECLSAIKAIPSADKPSGEWLDNGDRYFRCSLCGTKDTDRWHWCHGCGHPMKGADDD